MNVPSRSVSHRVGLLFQRLTVSTYSFIRSSRFGLIDSIASPSLDSIDSELTIAETLELAHSKYNQHANRIVSNPINHAYITSQSGLLPSITSINHIHHNTNHI
mmetsp:Transcript_2346/g.5044  ORF Transcript_2346/g.5044 Transcript_2346/m.5044 type:complete len:104 (+) Transcript_2346:226-537(+)